MLEEADGPLLERLREHRVVGVPKGLGNDGPSFVPLETLEVNEDALQLDNRQRRVGIVELDGDLLGEFLPRAFRLLEATDDVVERGGDPEILLLEAQLLAAVEVVVGVEDGADGLGSLLVRHGALVLAAVELLEIEFAARGLARPQPQVVGRRSPVTRNRHIVGDGCDRLAAVPSSHGPARTVRLLANLAIELYVHGHVVPGELPGVKVEPVVGDFDLVSVDDLLLEDAVTVSQTVAPGRKVERGQAVEEAGGKSAETSISQSGIMFLFNDVLNAETQVGKTSCRRGRGTLAMLQE